MDKAFLTIDPSSFGAWLVERIQGILGRKGPEYPCLVWYDPRNEWLELLRAASSAGGFELWADPGEHELILRDRFFNAKPAPRVIWRPCSRKDISWFKVFELEARETWETSLLEALRKYGVRIPREYERDLVPLLPTHAHEWFDQPKSAWRELTPGAAKGTLVDDHRMLEALAGELGEFDRFKEEDRFGIFARRALEDFGLSDPTEMAEKNWRVSTTARLLATEAAHCNPQDPPVERKHIIPPGLPRENALRMLKLWQSHVQFIPSFEKLVQEADKSLGLSYWAGNLSIPPRSRSSRLVEETLFRLFADRFDRIEDVDVLAGEMAQYLQVFQERASGFWGSLASNRVGWTHFVQLAEAASLIVENSGVEQSWKAVGDAVCWYSHRGWMLDQAGESLFLESPGLPERLHRIRARLRRSYLRKIDETGRAFSDLLATDYDEIFSLPTPGELALKELEQSKAPIALVFLDACSLQLGHRLAAALNKGEPVERASVKTAVAPVPSITALGMAFALPAARKNLHVAYSSAGKGFRVTDEGAGDLSERRNAQTGNLVLASERRKWLADRYKVKDFLTVAEALDSEKLKGAHRGRSVIVVEGLEFDSEGHEGQLQLTGAEEHLDRYTQAIRRLRACGYNRIVIVTDHGFFHWQPEADEIEDTKPEGDVCWLSRRAVVGHNLEHKSAVHLRVPCSDLEVMVPRSINTFRTYGGLGYFHGGATLQELIIPVLTVCWPAKATKIPIVLKPVGNITTEMPRVQIEAGVQAGQLQLFSNSAELARQVFVKIRERSTGKLVFRHSEAITVEPAGKPVTVKLHLVEPQPTIPYGTALVVEVLDADDEELLTREEVIIKVDIDEW